MLFMVMHKMDPTLEAGGAPDPKILSRMGELIGETIEKGMFHNAAGLKPSAERVRLRWNKGQRELTRGPLRGENELVAGFAMIKVASMDEAIAWATRFAEAEGSDGLELDVGPLVERWDLGLVPKPTGDVPLNALIVRKADEASESGSRPSPELVAKMDELLAEMKAAGVLLAAEGLEPSAKGARLTAKAGKHTWTDGPFAESKELIAGFTIIRVESLDAAKAWTTRYANVLGDTEVDVRRVQEG